MIPTNKMVHRFDTKDFINPAPNMQSSPASSGDTHSAYFLGKSSLPSTSVAPSSLPLQFFGTMHSPGLPAASDSRRYVEPKRIFNARSEIFLGRCLQGVKNDEQTTKYLSSKQTDTLYEDCKENNLHDLNHKCQGVVHDFPTALISGKRDFLDNLMAVPPSKDVAAYGGLEQPAVKVCEADLTKGGGVEGKKDGNKRELPANSRRKFEVKSPALMVSPVAQLNALKGENSVLKHEMTCGEIKERKASLDGNHSKECDSSFLLEVDSSADGKQEYLSHSLPETSETKASNGTEGGGSVSNSSQSTSLLPSKNLIQSSEISVFGQNVEDDESSSVDESASINASPLNIPEGLQIPFLPFDKKHTGRRGDFVQKCRPAFRANLKIYSENLLADSNSHPELAITVKQKSLEKDTIQEIIEEKAGFSELDSRSTHISLQNLAKKSENLRGMEGEDIGRKYDDEGENRQEIVTTPASARSSLAAHEKIMTPRDDQDLHNRSPVGTAAALPVTRNVSRLVSKNASKKPATSFKTARLRDVPSSFSKVNELVTSNTGVNILRDYLLQNIGNLEDGLFGVSIRDYARQKPLAANSSSELVGGGGVFVSDSTSEDKSTSSLLDMIPNNAKIQITPTITSKLLLASPEHTPGKELPASRRESDDFNLLLNRRKPVVVSHMDENMEKYVISHEDFQKKPRPDKESESTKMKHLVAPEFHHEELETLENSPFENVYNAMIGQSFLKILPPRDSREDLQLDGGRAPSMSLTHPVHLLNSFPYNGDTSKVRQSSEGNNEYDHRDSLQASNTLPTRDFQSPDNSAAHDTQESSRTAVEDASFSSSVPHINPRNDRSNKSDNVITGIAISSRTDTTTGGQSEDDIRRDIPHLKGTSQGFFPLKAQNPDLQIMCKSLTGSRTSTAQSLSQKDYAFPKLVVEARKLKNHSSGAKRVATAKLLREKIGIGSAFAAKRVEISKSSSKAVGSSFFHGKSHSVAHYPKLLQDSVFDAYNLQQKKASLLAKSPSEATSSSLSPDQEPKTLDIGKRLNRSQSEVLAVPPSGGRSGESKAAQKSTAKRVMIPCSTADSMASKASSGGRDFGGNDSDKVSYDKPPSASSVGSTSVGYSGHFEHVISMMKFQEGATTGHNRAPQKVERKAELPEVHVFPGCKQNCEDSSGAPIRGESSGTENCSGECDTIEGSGGGATIGESSTGLGTSTDGGTLTTEEGSTTELSLASVVSRKVTEEKDERTAFSPWIASSIPQSSLSSPRYNDRLPSPKSKDPIVSTASTTTVQHERSMTSKARNTNLSPMAASEGVADVKDSAKPLAKAGLSPRGPILKGNGSSEASKIGAGSHLRDQAHVGVRGTVTNIGASPLNQSSLNPRIPLSQVANASKKATGSASRKCLESGKISQQKVESRKLPRQEKIVAETPSKLLENLPAAKAFPLGQSSSEISGDVLPPEDPTRPLSHNKNDVLRENSCNSNPQVTHTQSAEKDNAMNMEMLASTAVISEDSLSSKVTSVTETLQNSSLDDLFTLVDPLGGYSSSQDGMKVSSNSKVIAASGLRHVGDCSLEGLRKAGNKSPRGLGEHQRGSCSSSAAKGNNYLHPGKITEASDFTCKDEAHFSYQNYSTSSTYLSNHSGHASRQKAVDKTGFLESNTLASPKVASGSSTISLVSKENAVNNWRYLSSAHPLLLVPPMDDLGYTHAIGGQVSESSNDAKHNVMITRDFVGVKHALQLTPTHKAALQLAPMQTSVSPSSPLEGSTHEVALVAPLHSSQAHIDGAGPNYMVSGVLNVQPKSQTRYTPHTPTYNPKLSEYNPLAKVVPDLGQRVNQGAKFPEGNFSEFSSHFLKNGLRLIDKRQPPVPDMATQFSVLMNRVYDPVEAPSIRAISTDKYSSPSRSMAFSKGQAENTFKVTHSKLVPSDVSLNLDMTSPSLANSMRRRMYSPSLSGSINRGMNPSSLSSSMLWTTQVLEARKEQDTHQKQGRQRGNVFLNTFQQVTEGLRARQRSPSKPFFRDRSKQPLRLVPKMPSEWGLQPYGMLKHRETPRDADVASIPARFQHVYGGHRAARQTLLHSDNPIISSQSNQGNQNLIPSIALGSSGGRNERAYPQEGIMAPLVHGEDLMLVDRLPVTKPPGLRSSSSMNILAGKGVQEMRENLQNSMHAGLPDGRGGRNEELDILKSLPRYVRTTERGSYVKLHNQNMWHDKAALYTSASGQRAAFQSPRLLATGTNFEAARLIASHDQLKASPRSLGAMMTVSHNFPLTKIGPYVETSPYNPTAVPNNFITSPVLNEGVVGAGTTPLHKLSPKPMKSNRFPALSPRSPYEQPQQPMSGVGGNGLERYNPFPSDYGPANYKLLTLPAGYNGSYPPYGGKGSPSMAPLGFPYVSESSAHKGMPPEQLYAPCVGRQEGEKGFYPLPLVEQEPPWVEISPQLVFNSVFFNPYNTQYPLPPQLISFETLYSPSRILGQGAYGIVIKVRKKKSLNSTPKLPLSNRLVPDGWPSVGISSSPRISKAISPNSGYQISERGSETHDLGLLQHYHHGEERIKKNSDTTQSNLRYDNFEVVDKAMTRVTDTDWKAGNNGFSETSCKDNYEISGASVPDKRGLRGVSQAGSGNTQNIFDDAGRDPKPAFCALKVMWKCHFFCRGLEKQLEREINCHLRCKHPNIVECYSAFSTDEHVFLLLEGMYYTLRRDFRLLASSTVAKFARDILKGVSYLHKNHIIHRDIKLTNVLFDEDGSAKLSDFGWCAETQVPEDSCEEDDDDLENLEYDINDNKAGLMHGNEYESKAGGFSTASNKNLPLGVDDSVATSETNTTVPASNILVQADSAIPSTFLKGRKENSWQVESPASLSHDEVFATADGADAVPRTLHDEDTNGKFASQPEVSHVLTDHASVSLREPRFIEAKTPKELSDSDEISDSIAFDASHLKNSTALVPELQKQVALQPLQLEQPYNIHVSTSDSITTKLPGPDNVGEYGESCVKLPVGTMSSEGNLGLERANEYPRTSGVGTDTEYRVAGQGYDKINHKADGDVLHKLLNPIEPQLDNTYIPSSNGKKNSLQRLPSKKATGKKKSMKECEVTGLAGSFVYMAPEVLQGDVPQTGKADIWSIGCCVFELLCGKPLFEVPQQLNTMNSVHTNDWIREELMNQQGRHYEKKILDALIAVNKEKGHIQDLEQVNEFLSLLLAKDARLRPTADEALQHAWLRI